MKRISGMLALWCALAGHVLTGQPPNATPGVWDRPAAALATQIAAIVGPGQISISMRNLSTIAAADVPSIRKLLEQDLKTRGVSSGGAESASAIRITLSEDSRERLWVAEIVEGSETRVAMVRLPLVEDAGSPLASGLVLHRQPIYQSGKPVLAAMELSRSLIVVEPERIAVFQQTQQGWKQAASSPFEALRAPSRDLRAMLLPSSDEHGFEAWLPGTVCDGADSSPDGGSWKIDCRQADDPWPISPAPVMPALAIAQAAGGREVPAATVQWKAFYNSSRDYFTGVVTPSPGADLPAFYEAVTLPLAGSQTGLLLEGLDGKVQLASTTGVLSVQGARDWGSDFAVVHTGCGSGMQVLASASGNSSTDGIGAYELAALQVSPSGTALAVDGAVVALSTTPDGTAAYAVVRTQQDRYEVDRVSATCN